MRADRFVGMGWWRRGRESLRTRVFNAGVLGPLFEEIRNHGRIIDHRGRILVKRINIDKKNSIYLKDIFHTLTHVSWWRIMAVFASVYVVTWCVFALILYGAHKHGCISNLDTYWDSLLFSIQTQATIGYGNYKVHPRTRCCSTVIVIAVQSLFGLALDAFTLALLFTKMSLPSKRTSTIMFSRKMVMSRLADGSTCLSFRLGDVHKEHLVEGHVTLLMYRRITTEEGETLDPEAFHLRVGPCEYLPLLLPQVISHKVTPDSPLWGITSRGQMEEALGRVEFVAMYEGSSATMSTSVQARRSYTVEDVVWGAVFQKCVSRLQDGSVVTNFVAFQLTVPQSNWTMVDSSGGVVREIAVGVITGDVGGEGEAESHDAGAVATDANQGS